MKTKLPDVDSMRFEINFEQSPDYVCIRTGGEASVEGFEELLKGIVGSPNWTPGVKQLVDHRELKIDALTADDVRRIRDVVKEYSQALGDGRCAFVVADALGFGLIRMYENTGGDQIHQEVAVFYEIDKATEWLMS